MLLIYPLGGKENLEYGKGREKGEASLGGKRGQLPLSLRKKRTSARAGQRKGIFSDGEKKGGGKATSLKCRKIQRGKEGKREKKSTVPSLIRNREEKE